MCSTEKCFEKLRTKTAWSTANFIARESHRADIFVLVFPTIIEHGVCCRCLVRIVFLFGFPHLAWIADRTRFGRVVSLASDVGWREKKGRFFASRGQQEFGCVPRIFHAPARGRFFPCRFSAEMSFGGTVCGH